MTDRARLAAANAEQIDLAYARLHQLRMLEIDVLAKTTAGGLRPERVEEPTKRVLGAVDTLQKEIAAREDLDRALARRPDPVRDADIEATLARLDALRAAQRDAYYRGEAKVADPCIPCLQKAYIDGEIKRLEKIPGMTKKRLKKAVSRIKRKLVQADPELLRKINDQLGTKVNFAALSRFEGGQWTHGYVPPAGRSGVTIGTGFDVGQWHARDLRRKLGLPEELAQRLDPYTGRIRDDAVAELRRNPLAVTRDEANVIDQAVHRYFVESTRDTWDAHRGAATPAYDELSSAQQTVLFSRTYHQGVGMRTTAVAQNFYHAAQRNDWDAAERHLRNYPVRPQWYRERVGAEAALLRGERDG
jgi:hypothetical protein